MKTAPLQLVPPPARTDDALCRAYLAGDTQALGALLARHQSAVLAIVRRYAYSPDEARELTQRAMVQAVEAAQRTFNRFFRLGREVPFRAWLLRIAINLGKNHRRDSSRWRLTPLEALSGHTAQGEGQAAALERAEERSKLQELIVSLPKRQREVLHLRIDAGLPFAEISELLGISESSAKVHFHHAVKRLKGALAKPEGATS